MRKCKKCQNVKPLEDFPKFLKKYTGTSGEVKSYVLHRHKCKQCFAIQMKSYMRGRYMAGRKNLLVAY